MLISLDIGRDIVIKILGLMWYLYFENVTFKRHQSFHWYVTHLNKIKARASYIPAACKSYPHIHWYKNIEGNANFFRGV